MGYDRVEQIREGISGDGLEGDFYEEGLPSGIQSQLECLHGWSVHNLLWQFAPIRGYSNVERMLAVTGFTSLLVNLETLIENPKAGKSRRSCTMQIRSPRILLRTREKSRSRWRAVGRGAALLQTSSQLLEHFLAPGNPGREWGDACIAYSRCGRINALYKGSGWRRIALGKKHSTKFFW